MKRPHRTPLPHRPLPTKFHPDLEGIIPVLDGEWFEDDLVARPRDFLRVTFGPDTLNENMRFIETALGKELHKYFLTDFYKDHLQTYKERPIYWMVQSPKRGFAVFIFLNCYTKDTLNGYLRDYQVKLRNRLAHLTEEQATASTAKFGIKEAPGFLILDTEHANLRDPWFQDSIVETSWIKPPALVPDGWPAAVV